MTVVGASEYNLRIVFTLNPVEAGSLQFGVKEDYLYRKVFPDRGA